MADARRELTCPISVSPVSPVQSVQSVQSSYLVHSKSRRPLETVRQRGYLYSEADIVTGLRPVCEPFGLAYANLADP